MQALSAPSVAQWSAVLRQCQAGAAVHCDAAAAELLRWTLHPDMADAAAGLLSLTADREQLPLPHHRRLVLVLAGADTSPAATVALIEHVVSAMPQLRHVALVPLQPQLLPDDIVDRTQAWMARSSAVPADDTTWQGATLVDIAAAATVVACPITPHLATLPSLHSLNKSLATSLVAKTLRHTLANLGSRIDCWALGERAGKLAKAVCQAGALDPAPNADVALILLDRACDLVQVLRRGKAAGDILSATLPHWAANSTDLKIPLASALPNVPESYRPDGSLANPRDASGGGALQSLLAGTTKAGLAAARKLLGAGDAADVETAARELWQAAPTADNVPVLSLALASVAAHRGLAAADYSAALAVETMVLSAAAGDADFISQLVDMVALLPQDESNGKKHSPQTVFRLAVLLFAFQSTRLLRGDAAVAGRQQLAKVLAHAVHARQTPTPNVAETTQRLDALLQAAQESQYRTRSVLRTFGALSNRDGFYAPLMTRVADQVLQREAPMAEDWRYETTEPQSIASSAMGLLGGVLGGGASAPKRRPTDASVIVFYVEGSSSWEELGCLQASIQRFKPRADVLLLTPIVADPLTALSCAVDLDEATALGVV